MKYPITLTVIFVLVSHIAYSQQKQKNSVKINTLLLPWKAYNLSYERALGEYNSLQIDIVKIHNSAFIDTGIDGLVYSLDYRLYNRAKKKTYISPFIKYQKIEFESNTAKIRHSNLGGGILVGKLFNLNEKKSLQLDINFGVNYMPFEYKVVYAQYPDNLGMDIPKTLANTFIRIGAYISYSF